MRRALVNISKEDLPLKKGDFMELIALCVNCGVFVFEGQEYVQPRGLVMGSLLSAVMAC